jgi:hypothetical protein
MTTDLDLTVDAASIARRINAPAKSGASMRGLFWLDGHYRLYSVDSQSYEYYSLRHPKRLIGTYAPPVTAQMVREDLESFHATV